jgi:hypothetical protein
MNSIASVQKNNNYTSNQNENRSSCYYCRLTRRHIHCSKKKTPLKGHEKKIGDKERKDETKGHQSLIEEFYVYIRKRHMYMLSYEDNIYSICTHET